MYGLKILKTIIIIMIIINIKLSWLLASLECHELLNYFITINNYIKRCNKNIFRLLVVLS